MQSDVTVTQADVKAAALYWVSRKERETSLDDIRYFEANWSSLPGMKACVQAFARHRLAALADAQGEPVAAQDVAALVSALAKARRIIADIDDYMKRPDRGDWGVECACCIGELLDDDRDAIAVIDAALAKHERTPHD